MREGAGTSAVKDKIIPGEKSKGHRLWESFQAETERAHYQQKPASLAIKPGKR